MRGYGVAKHDAPDTIAQGGRGLCATCANRQGKPPADTVDDTPCVDVRVRLRPSTYRAFALRGKELGVAEVGELLSRLADRALGPRVNAEDPIDRRIRTLNADGLTDTAIARAVGMSQPTVSRRRRALGLQSPRPRGPSRKAA